MARPVAEVPPARITLAGKSVDTVASRDVDLR